MTHTPCFIQFSICHEHPKYNQNVPPLYNPKQPNCPFFHCSHHLWFKTKKKKGFKKKRWSEVDFVNFKFQLLQKILDAHEILQRSATIFERTSIPKALLDPTFRRKPKIQDSLEWTNQQVSLKNVSCILESQDKLFQVLRFWSFQTSNSDSWSFTKIDKPWISDNTICFFWGRWNLPHHHPSVTFKPFWESWIIFIGGARIFFLLIVIEGLRRLRRRLLQKTGWNCETHVDIQEISKKNCVTLIVSINKEIASSQINTSERYKANLP